MDIIRYYDYGIRLNTQGFTDRDGRTVRYQISDRDLNICT
jgi:hypothetical protein